MILLQNTPNCHRLNIDLCTELVDGNRWEEIIRNHLPNLEVIQLKMKIALLMLQDSTLRDQFVVIKKKQRFFDNIFHGGCEKIILFSILCSEF
jgi:hypothetical protein